VPVDSPYNDPKYKGNTTFFCASPSETDEYFSGKRIGFFVFNERFEYDHEKPRNPIHRHISTFDYIYPRR
jgi:hypothetical protein